MKKTKTGVVLLIAVTISRSVACVHRRAKRDPLGRRQSLSTRIPLFRLGPGPCATYGLPLSKRGFITVAFSGARRVRLAS